MTPWQSLTAAKAMGNRARNEARQRMSAAWHSAAFQRSKRLPRLQQVIGEDQGRRPTSGAEIVSALKAKFGAK